MPITKNKKQEIITDLSSKINKADTMVFVSFKGISANDQVVMRKKLRSENVNYTVIKKSLLKRVLTEKGFEGELPQMDGEMAIAYATDQLAPAREIYAFQKSFKKGLTIQGGAFGGVYKSKVDMMSIATIPGRETLLSQIAFLLASPMQRLAIAVNEVAKTK
jgi:large subunit ribosomal protein L10